MDHMEIAETGEDHAFIFDDIINHKKNKNGKYDFLVKCQSGEKTWDPLTLMGQQDPVTIATYAAGNDLLNKPGWRRFRRYVQPSTRRFIKQAVTGMKATKKSASKYKFGVEILQNYKHAMDMDANNGNNGWKEAFMEEVSKIKGYNIFRPIKNNKPPSRF